MKFYALKALGTSNESLFELRFIAGDDLKESLPDVMALMAQDQFSGFEVEEAIFSGVDSGKEARFDVEALDTNIDTFASENGLSLGDTLDFIFKAMADDRFDGFVAMISTADDAVADEDAADE